MNDIEKLKYIVDRFKSIERSIDEIKIEIMDFFIECEHTFQISERRIQDAKRTTGKIKDT